jgi:hypothetical protein
MLYLSCRTNRFEMKDPSGRIRVHPLPQLGLESRDRHRRAASLSFLLVGVLATLLPKIARSAGPEDLNVAAAPQRPYVERRGSEQKVNFDLLVENRGLSNYRLVAIKLAVFDSEGELELEREVNQNGNPPGINLIGDRGLPSHGVMDIYQPFFEFDSRIALDRLRYELLFVRDGHPSPPVALGADEIVTLEVSPFAYHPARFCLPLRGLLLVHDGHDYYSHHRRYNLTPRYRSAVSSAVSANLYAEDLVRVTPDGRLFAGDPLRKESWLTYGQPVLAPAVGQVIEALDGVPENSFQDDGEAHIPAESAAVDPLGLGNHVKVQHADGRVSWMLHLQPGSVTVKVGDRVRGGEPIGRVGFTGDSLFPHLHYNVTESASYPSPGTPVYFKRFQYVVGSRRLSPREGQIDTGDLIRSDDCR